MTHIRDPWMTEQLRWSRFSTNVLEFMLKEEDSNLNEFEVECIKNVIKMREVAKLIKPLPMSLITQTISHKGSGSND